MIYLGNMGRMVPIKCPASQQVVSAERYSFATTLGGAVKAQAGPVGKRSWKVGLGSLSTPSDVGAIMDFANGVWGPGPFWFVPTDGPVVNMLTPKAAACHRAEITLRGGAEILGTPPMILGGGEFAAQSVWTNGVGTAQLGNPVPVHPGEPVTASAWVVGSGSVRVEFLSSADIITGFGDSTLVETSTVRRASVTRVAPPGSVAARVQITAGITQATRPALTWTPEVYEWGDGQGCEKAILHNVDRDLTKAWRDPRTGRWSDVSFTVQEIG